MNITQPVSSHISNVGFGLLSTEEIKALSVRKITNPETFNSLLHATVNGLYDPSLGSLLNGYCQTCNLRDSDGCPGHCGHIELPVMVYHPTFMDQCLKLLRGKCVFCHRFRLPRTVISQYCCRLRLVHHGLLKESEEMSDIVKSQLESGKAANQNSDSDSDSDDGGDDTGLVHGQNTYTFKAIKAHLKAGGSCAATNNQAVGEARTELVRQFFADIGKYTKCASCGGFSPRFRKDKYLKIFRKSLARKHQIGNIQGEMKMRNPLVILNSKRKQSVRTKSKSNGIVLDEGVADLDTSEANSSEGESEALDIEMGDLEEHIEEDVQFADASRQPKSRQKGQPEETHNYFMTSEEVHAALVLLFEEECELLRLIYSPRSKGRALGKLSADMFFISTLLVPPIKFRPEHPSQTEEVSEASKNRLYKAILKACEKIAEIHREMKTGQKHDPILTERTPRNYNHLKLAQVELQDAVNALIDKSSSTGSNNAKQEEGVKQMLEKKQGLFRQNMMGKRVNFAGRSVISPDPNIETNEIGVPPVFAKKLTYPEPVTNHNYYELKEAILNGPDDWPGAVAVENEDGQVISLRGKSAEDRLAIANQLLAPSKNTMNGRFGKKVHRHLNNGDIVIMNRQPTLHKPSMMCHRTRVLPGEKTIRMHYANCNTYNADFDGDEMNMHFPQNELARAEANTIADTDHQYLSGTAGKPLRGLIQDHISMGVHLTNRDTFFDREEYQQLLYSAMRPEDNHTVTGTLVTVTPAIMKPKPLWTGKQVISTILKNITSKNHMGLTLTSKSQTAGDRWGAFIEEEIVIIRDGELLTGIIDKKQIGPASGGLVHAVYETFGHTTAGRLLSVLGRLLTKLLHIRAFSCGVEDLILTPEGERIRLENLEAAKTLGLQVATKYVTLEKRNPTSSDPELLRRLEMVQRDEDQMKGLDEITKKHNGLLSSEITKACLPDGLVKPFPRNQMQAMTGSGAKGTQVNANLISCNLGQQVLEGRRVPTMISGKTLPCFKPFESSIRAGGYIVDRFLTGVKPQEYYFHAMAGREGLIDTAVKTSRSGYLQRCIVKGMEGLKVEYDISVRDADGSVIQFLYGEDGLDVCKQTYLKQFKFMAENFFSLYNNMQVRELYPRIQCEEASAHNKKASKGFAKRGLDESRDPVLSIYSPSRYAGSMSEKYYLALRKYIDENKDKIFEDKKKGIKGVARKKNFEALLEVKYLNSLVEPGEAVGVVAGQSVGEPSTQMTLNTFHLAGHSSKNVTLGIPRLREIVMTASAKISTPMMTLHLNPELTQAGGEKFAKEISRLSLSDVVDKITVTETVKKGIVHSRSKFYHIKFKFFPAEEYHEEYNIKVEDVLDALAKKLLPALQRTVRAEWKKKGVQKVHIVTDAAPELGVSSGRVEQESSRPARVIAEGDSEAGSDIDEEDASAARKKANRAEDDEWADPDEEEEEIASQMSEEEGLDIGGEEEEDDDDENENDKPTEFHSDEASDLDVRDVDGTEAAGQRQNKKIYIQKSAAELDAWVKGITDNSYVSAFKFDPSGGWCEVTLEYPASWPKILMLQLVEQLTRNAVIRAVHGIKSCFFNKDNKSKDSMTGESRVEPVIVTEGINLIAMRDYQDILNPHKMFTNDIAAMLAHYGVEACRATIVVEMDGVFAGHGIDVDLRHLNLIADCMTRRGGYLAFNRAGLRNQASPFMKMSFETTIGFLKDAVLCEDYDDLKNPSARIVVGRVNGVGTGSFDLLVPTADIVRERTGTVEV